jgi:serine/threonine-protein kinase ULK4
MEKYHIYEEIGKGEFSQVFKGREKKRIEFVAIKRTEKSVMNKVNSLSFFLFLFFLNFVSLLHYRLSMKSI